MVCTHTATEPGIVPVSLLFCERVNNRAKARKNDLEISVLSDFFKVV